MDTDNELIFAVGDRVRTGVEAGKKASPADIPFLGREGVVAEVIDPQVNKHGKPRLPFNVLVDFGEPIDGFAGRWFKPAELERLDGVTEARA